MIREISENHRAKTTGAAWREHLGGLQEFEEAWDSILSQAGARACQSVLDGRTHLDEQIVRSFGAPVRGRDRLDWGYSSSAIVRVILDAARSWSETRPAFLKPRVLA